MHKSFCAKIAQNAHFYSYVNHPAFIRFCHFNYLHVGGHLLSKYMLVKKYHPQLLELILIIENTLSQ